MSRPFALALMLAAVAALGGCALRQAQGDTTSFLPMGVMVRQAHHDTAQAHHDTTKGPLLYVSDTETNAVYVYTYPAGKLMQTLKDFHVPGGECVDAAGDVFITNTGDESVEEYAHGGDKAKATLKDQGYFPFGCSVDPTTGNLAVANFSSGSSGAGNVVIYDKARGSVKKSYSDVNLSGPLLCGYDDKGNLFVDGFAGSSTPAYAELPRGAKTFTDLTLNQSIGSPGGVMWDGKYVAIGDETTDIVYRFAVSGKNATSKGSVTLAGGSVIVQFWIDGGRIAGANSSNGTAGIWKYPAGGSPVKTISGLYIPLGITLSK